jgi:hypothetical protein
MKSAREKLLREFPLKALATGPDEELANSLYALLRSIDGLQVTVDGWSYVRVVRESPESLGAVGLMTLLPSGSIPIEIEVKANNSGVAWMVQVAQTDSEWLALSESKRWNRVYLYATGERATPQWSWGESLEGSAPHATTSSSKRNG